jgi:hypothetical protein
MNAAHTALISTASDRRRTEVPVAKFGAANYPSNTTERAQQ